MIETDLSLENFTPTPGVITSLSQLTRDQFLELISSDHPEAKKYRRYTKKEFEYRNKSYQALNDFFNRDKNVSI
jgi:hypothetical protein